MRGGRWSWWMAHSTRRSLPPISSKGSRRASTSHSMMPQLNTSHFSVYVMPSKT